MQVKKGNFCHFDVFGQLFFYRNSFLEFLGLTAVGKCNSQRLLTLCAIPLKILFSHTESPFETEIIVRCLHAKQSRVHGRVGRGTRALVAFLISPLSQVSTNCGETERQSARPVFSKSLLGLGPGPRAWRGLASRETIGMPRREPCA